VYLLHTLVLQPPYLLSLTKSYHDAKLDYGWKSVINENMTALHATKT